MSLAFLYPFLNQALASILTVLVVPLVAKLVVTGMSALDHLLLSIKLKAAQDLAAAIIKAAVQKALGTEATTIAYADALLKKAVPSLDPTLANSVITAAYADLQADMAKDALYASAYALPNSSQTVTSTSSTATTPATTSVTTTTAPTAQP